MDIEILIEQAEESVNCLVSEFQSNVFNFLYEADIQAVLYSKLKDKIDETITLEVEKEINKLKIGKIIATNIVKAEYPVGSRFDIVLIHPGSRVRMENKNNGKENEAFWKQNLLVAIELKYHQLGDSHTIRRIRFLSDIQKLEAMKDSFKFGLALLFVMVDNAEEKYGKILKLRETEEGIKLTRGIRSYVVDSKRIYETKGTH